MNQVQLPLDLTKYPKKDQKYLISQSMKSSRVVDTYGKSYTAASIPDVVSGYNTTSGSTELLFIKVVSNDIVSSVEGVISEIFKTNHDRADPFLPFSATVFLASDLNKFPPIGENQRKISLLLQKHKADGIINFEIPDLSTEGLSRFGEIWAIVRNEYVEKNNFNESRKEYLKDPEKFKNSLISIVTEKINDFQKLNPISRDEVKKRFTLIDFEAITRTEFTQNTLQRYLEYINTHSNSEIKEQ